ncbi:MAG: DUF1365 domain-containing protein [Rhodoferax sp.]
MGCRVPSDMGVFDSRPYIGFGQVRHTRLRPRRHGFAYATFFLVLPMRAWAAQDLALARNRWAALSFFDADHGDGRGPERGGALGWLDALLTHEGIVDATGPVWLQCYPRVWGYTFKPVSFWFCHRSDGCLRAIVVEVNNTFGERHCYVLDAPRLGAELRAAKVFHVSPFCRVEGGYRFRFECSADGQRWLARIDYDDANGPLIQTSLSGRLQPLDAAARRRALWAHPLLTLGVIGRIHWQALQLWLKRMPFFRKPPAPTQFSTR